VHLAGFTIEIYYDARLCGRQITLRAFSVPCSRVARF